MQVIAPLVLFIFTAFGFVDSKVTFVFAPLTDCVSLEPTCFFRVLLYAALIFCVFWGSSVGGIVSPGSGVGCSVGV